VGVLFVDGRGSFNSRFSLFHLPSSRLLDFELPYLFTSPLEQRILNPLSPFFSRRTAIEEELEVLYDAYYDELEQYANHQQEYAASGGTIPPPAGPGPFPGSVELDRNGALIRPDHLAPQQPKPLSGVPISQQPGKWARRSTPGNPDEEGDEEDDEEDEEYSDDGGEDDEEVSLSHSFDATTPFCSRLRASRPRIRQISSIADLSSLFLLVPSLL